MNSIDWPRLLEAVMVTGAVIALVAVIVGLLGVAVYTASKGEWLPPVIIATLFLVALVAVVYSGLR